MDEDQNTNEVAQQPAESVSGASIDSVKARALQALVPLMDSLDVEPERKFDICISAMRFTDNKDLAEVALQTALKIEQAGTKAEALVELINEINYLQTTK